jgi:hypothetical protein
MLMATDTAVAPPPTKPFDPTRNIWQVPLFLFAAVLFAATWKGWLPIGPPSVVDQFNLDVAALSNTYERVSPEPKELTDLLKKVASNIDLSSDKNETHFILGSGYVKLAELTPSFDEARTHWLLAQQHFDSVDRERLNEKKIDSAKAKFIFRGTKARVAIGLAPETLSKEYADLIKVLDSTPYEDYSGEALRLRAELALKMSPPDLGTARDSLTRYLTGTLSTPPLIREHTKILLADIHYRFKELDKARTWLENVAPDAPPDVVVAAKTLLGRVYMAESNWGPASREWEAIRTMPNVTQLFRATATYQLGVCKLNTHEPDAAVKLFEEVVKGEESPETSAADFRLAEQYLKSSDPLKREACADLLAKAMKSIRNSQDLRNNKNNTSLDVTDVNATFELAFANLVADGRYEAALKVAGTYAPLSESGRDREKRAEILAVWATVLQRSTSSAKLDFKPKALEAAKEYLAFESLQTAVGTKADALRKAAAMFKLADQPADAVVALQAAIKLPKLPEEMAGAVWVDLADALIAAKRPNEVWPALNEAMAAVGPVSTKTRFHLASHFKEEQIPELRLLGRYLFEQIAKQTDISPAEQEYQEKALLALGDEYLRLRDFTAAERWLSQQLHSYPTGSQAPLARMLLGACLLQISSVPPPNGPTPAKAAAQRDEALKLFREVVSDMDAKLKKDAKLSDHDSWLRVQASIRVLQAHLMMRNHNDLLYESEDLRQRYRGTVEELIILSLIYKSFEQKGDTVKKLQTRDKMKELFDSIPVDKFNSSATEYTRIYWEKTWFSEK